jgi:hypothetical protein
MARNNKEREHDSSTSASSKRSRLGEGCGPDETQDLTPARVVQ